MIDFAYGSVDATTQNAKLDDRSIGNIKATVKSEASILKVQLDSDFLNSNLAITGQWRLVDGYPGEIPVLISHAFALAQGNGLTITALARELACSLPRLRLLLGDTEADTRPQLRLV